MEELRKERDRYRDELTKVLKEREKLKEELEYERNVCGKDAELEKLLQHCTVDELERVCQERDDLREKVSTSERDDEEETRQRVLIAALHSRITGANKKIFEMQETEQRLRKQRDEHANYYKEKYKETQTTLDIMHGTVLEINQKLGEMNAEDKEFLRRRNAKL
tara:strand:- start:303 stop:794 length:492 start_codon:yes stop_codon:yes gene_type:complete